MKTVVKMVWAVLIFAALFASCDLFGPKDGPLKLPPSGNYTVVYHASGGGGTMEPSTFAYHKEYPLRKNAFTSPMEGYVFGGWYSSHYGKTYQDEEKICLLDPRPEYVENLYATWIYVVVFDANGGNGTMRSAIYSYGDIYQILSANTFTKEGCVFAGWAETPEGDRKYADRQAVRDLATNGRVTLYALWSEGAYTVYYNADGGTGVMPNSVFFIDYQDSLTPSVLSRTGYIFLGWRTSNWDMQYADGQTVYNLTTAGNWVTLFAMWGGNIYTVVYDANGGSGAMEDSDFYYGLAQNLRDNTFTRAGYGFAGWAMSPNGAIEYADGESVSSLTETMGETVTLYAVWGHPYTVKFDANGGSGTIDDVTFFTDIQTMLPSNTFTREGYGFAGWATSPNGPVEHANMKSVNNLTDGGSAITLYAVWRGNSYTVRYNANGGSGNTMYNQSFTYDAAPQALRTNTFTRTGYVFKGWATSRDGAVEYTNGESVINLSTGATVDLYAVWAGTYTVRYNANGGGGTMANSSFTLGDAQALYVNAFTRTGYTFVGWAMSANGEAVYTDGQSVTNLTETALATVNLYAVWIINPATAYTVKYHADDGSGRTESSYFIFSIAQNLSNPFTRAGYTLTGWAVSPNGAKVYNDGQSVTDLTGTAGATVDLYAVWRAHTYTVKYHANGGIGAAPADQNFTYDAAPQALRTNTFTRTNFDFKGWATSPNGAVEYTNGQSVSNLTAADGETVTLYAVWGSFEYTVVYYAGSGSGTQMENSTFTYGVAQNLRLNTYTRGEGYTFAGWATSVNGAAEYTDGQSVSNLTGTVNGTVNLYARWRAHAYTVVFNVNGGSGTMSSQSFYYGTAQNLRTNDFVRAGHTFTGWSILPDGGANYTDRQSVNNLTAVDGATITLYAVWRADTSTIVFIANGGSGTMANQYFTFGVAQNLRKNTFTRTCYVFAGWALAANTAVDFTDEQSISGFGSGTMTLYAKWLPVGGVVPGTTLASKLSWLESNAGSNCDYTIEVTANESISFASLTYGEHSERTNIKITLQGIGAPRVISNLSSGSRLFTVGSGVTLVLDNNIELRSSVGVQPSGTLIMNAGSRISDTRVSGSGGGVYIFQGTFIMNGGTISGNTATGNGGGVSISGTFTMNGGTITGNTATESGGGVYIYYGRLQKTGGTISGYSAGDSFNISNVVRTSSGSIVSGQGHAVYVRLMSSDFPTRWETTAGPTVNLDTNTTAGWERN